MIGNTIILQLLLLKMLTQPCIAPQIILNKEARKTSSVVIGSTYDLISTRNQTNSAFKKREKTWTNQTL